MPDTESGFDPDLPVEVTYTVKFLTYSSEMAENFTHVLGLAVGVAVQEISRSFGSAVEVIEDAELPATEVMERDEV